MRMANSPPDDHSHASSETISFSSQAYSLEEIKKAAYRFSDVISVDFALRDEEVICTLNFIKTTNEDDMQLIVHDFKNEVLDQNLRKTIGEETREIRNVVLAYAFSKSGLQEDE